MQLAALIRSMGLDLSVPDIELTDIHLDSRQVTPKSAFVCYQGHHQDGKQFIEAAIEQGAAVILADAPMNRVVSIPVIIVPQLAHRVGELAAHFFGEPSRSLQMVGITGTNGKTSICHYLANALRQTHKKVGTLGTLGMSIIAGDYQYNGMTTPDPISLQRYLQQFKEAHCEWVVMEVSSHALDQARTQSIAWDYGVFTNLSQDHLDYHESMESYAKAKQKLFQAVKGAAIINADDKAALNMLQACHSTCRHILYGQTFQFIPPQAGHAFVKGEILQQTYQGMRVQLTTSWGNIQLEMPLVGQFNLSNVLAVVCILCDLGLSWEEMIQILQHLQPPPGRLQRFYQIGLPTVWVDFAHTPDGLDKVLATIRPIVSGKLWVVFGCGGDRDKTKRPLMAAIAEQYADYILLTQDNSRTESPEHIIKDLLSGMHNPTQAMIELDRATAIQYALTHAASQDGILIAGRGHEATLHLNHQTIHFSDIDFIQDYFNERTI